MARMYFAHEKNMNLGMSEDRCDRLSSYVEILTSRTSECDFIENRVFTDVIS